MPPRLLVGTRKGTFIVSRGPSGLRPHLPGHAGSGVNFAARDPHTRTMVALLGHGHCGAQLVPWGTVLRGVPQPC